MPVLPICRRTDGITHEEMTAVYAVMLYPDDEIQREEFSKLMAHESVIEFARALDVLTSALPTSTVVLSSEMYRALVFDPPEGQTAEIARRARKGRMAAFQTRIVHSLAHHAPEHASRRKAAFLMERLADRANLPSGHKSQIDDAWSTFGCVAHLWAAYRCVEDPFLTIDEIGYTTEVNFHALLTRAESFRTWREDHISPPRRKGAVPFFKPGAAWRPPPNWDSPPWREEWPPKNRISPLPLSDLMKQDLATYGGSRTGTSPGG